MKRATLLFLSCTLTAIIGLSYWSYEGRLKAVPDAGVSQIDSVSFSPYRRGQNPLAHITPTLTEISQDIEVLAGRVGTVRTYTSLEGLEMVPRFARPLGLKVMQGAWLGREPDVNEREIRSVIDLANRYPDVIDRVVVGNEVLLRKDLTAEQLAGYIERVRAAVKQPVTYADVWEFWLRNPQLAPHVDFITIHILPYWEDDPIAIEHAVDHVMAIYARVRAAFPGKRVMIGEVGWPSEGRMRDGALPSPANQARLVRGFLKAANGQGVDYNIFAAFDEPWKTALEGTVGGHWGIFDADRNPKFALAGPISDDPAWRWHFALSALFASIATILLGRSHERLRFAGLVIVASAAQAFGIFLVLDLRYAAATSYTPTGWLLAIAGFVANLFLAALLLRALADSLSGRPWPTTPLPTAEEALNFLRGRPTRGPTLGERALGMLQFGFIVAAAVIAITLVVDPRYRDFPSEVFLLPAVGFAALAIFRDRRAPLHASLREESLLVALLVFGAIGAFLAESLASLERIGWHTALAGAGRALENSEALGWSATLLLLALPWTLKLAARGGAVPAPAVA
ncbi:MAG TPA: glycosyl hydrolase family 17 protein [Alphaproteobacteria bacterium]|nr:glycosyl hydrolase family 17 protein [Alphaproteobacteria bacterium]